MAKMKIFLEEDESLEQVETDLVKAFQYHVNGEAHEAESFDDPAMIAIHSKLKELHQETFQSALKEIIEVLDKDYTK